MYPTPANQIFKTESRSKKIMLSNGLDKKLNKDMMTLLKLVKPRASSSSIFKIQICFTAFEELWLIK